MRHLAITAIGQDRPGIVAAATEAFVGLQCNLADCSMTRLGGQFAMILLLEAPDKTTQESLEAALRPACREFDLSVHVQDVDITRTDSPRRPYVLSLYGADHPGIVHSVARKVAEYGANITDLVSRVVGSNIFTMVMDVDLPPDLDEKALEGDLLELSRTLNVDLTLRSSETADF